MIAMGGRALRVVDGGRHGAPIEREPYPEGVRRPSCRAECEPCETCAEFVEAVDAQMALPGARPACGHDPTTSIYRCRPCPFVACEAHLYLDVNPQTGTVKINFPGIEPGDMAESCANDVADRSATRLEEIGAIMNLTRERIRQVETKGLRSMRSALRRAGFAEEALDLLRERYNAIDTEDEWPDSMAHGDAPALMAMLSRWEERAGIAMTDRVWAVLGRSELSIVAISQRMAEHVHRPSLRIALAELVRRRRVSKRVAGGVTLYRRKSARRG